MAIYLIPLLIALAGLFAAFCAVKDYEWFMGHRKAQALTRIFGRTAVRVFYAALGIVLFLVGLVAMIAGPDELDRALGGGDVENASELPGGD